MGWVLKEGERAKRLGGTTKCEERWMEPRISGDLWGSDRVKGGLANRVRRRNREYAKKPTIERV